ncbi:MAG: thiazole synthase [Candidatus Azobacteroides pseudotrichonymphae]|jgi:thiazole synthase|uniref:thiazole synthase n=1 Tax=Azobacteroides pseudotrichonymphae genomovar. CFP2 TaxID=511995 RepID=B6YS03_AZOPC|nr:thiazole synthase [Candidatus Azobacteroides pseudotrichonymphae]MDR0530402.1 thiazole synthase [Bacteroidales bacterium OttesenSCG-928-I14]BAG83975.1 thiamine biosynthesis protein ThiG [Candidatus Azobacteroides pseudotrichonymphae genomovar. CFP2]GMO33898.1 MAG: thiazole synthase [Candidatus Azobacteroides pseudotrichonymphae]
MDKDSLDIAGLTLNSRVFIGSGKFPDNELIPEIIKASGSQVITVAVRRFDFNNVNENILEFIPEHVFLMPNTSGARNAEEAVRIANIARATVKTDLIKIEIMTDNKYLLPDNYQTAKACELLVKEGFKAFAYMNADLYAARDMQNAGASAIMPLGSPIGTNKGLQTKEMIRILIEEMDAPIIVDAGIGKPSDACECMEMGCTAVMINTAISSSESPILMASAFKNAVKAGRKAFVAKLGTVSTVAKASSPLTNFLNES